MSFYDIEDREERDAKIKEYLALKDRLKNRYMDDRLAGLHREEDMREMFKPVLESNAEMAKEITQDLVPIKQELETLNETIQNRQNRIQPSTPRKLPELPMDTPPRPRSGSEPERYGHTASTYLKKALTEGNESVTGVRYEGPDMMIGDKKIELRGSDLKIEDQTYKGTPGLWSLITERKPKGYTDEDLGNYRDIMIETNALYRNNDPDSGRPRANGSEKWRKLQKPIWNEMHDAVDGRGLPFGYMEQLNAKMKQYEHDPTVRKELVAFINELLNM